MSIKQQRAYVREYQDTEVKCPACGESININQVIDGDNLCGAMPSSIQCPVCSKSLEYCLGLFTGQQWFVIKD